MMAAYAHRSDEDVDPLCNEVTEVTFPDGTTTLVRFRGVPEGLTVGTYYDHLQSSFKDAIFARFHILQARRSGRKKNAWQTTVQAQPAREPLPVTTRLIATGKSQVFVH